MDKQTTIPKKETTTKKLTKTNNQQKNTYANAKKLIPNKEVKSAATITKKDGNKLKPRGKNSEVEKQSLKRSNERQATRIKFAAGGKNSKKEKKSLKKNYILDSGKKY